MTTTTRVFSNSQEIRQALSENRGRHPVSDRGIDIRAKRRNSAWRAYVRIAGLASNRKLMDTNPRLYLDANQWMYEIEHGKASIQIDQRITGHVSMSFDDVVLLDSIQGDNNEIMDAEYEQLAPPDAPSIAPIVDDNNDDI